MTNDCSVNIQKWGPGGGSEVSGSVCPGPMAWNVCFLSSLDVIEAVYQKARQIWLASSRVTNNP
jgi:hypothetical protein